MTEKRKIWQADNDKPALCGFSVAEGQDTKYPRHNLDVLHLLMSPASLMWYWYKRLVYRSLGHGFTTIMSEKIVIPHNSYPNG